MMNKLLALTIALVVAGLIVGLAYGFRLNCVDCGQLIDRMIMSGS